MKLIEPTNELKFVYLDYIIEWEESEQKIVPYASRRDNRDYEQLIEAWQQDKTDKAYDKGFVPSTIYFMIDIDNKMIGAIHIRHELNEKLLLDGGHIGYGIRPTERGKGYGSIMLGLALDMMKVEGYQKVLITCDESNIPSARVIENNGGILENIVDADGELTKRYWISL